MTMSLERITFGAIALITTALLYIYLNTDSFSVEIWATVPAPIYFRDLMNLTESSEAAARLPTSGQLFCFVITAEQYYETRVPAVNETWLKRCDNGQFFVKEPLNDTSIPFSTAFEDLDDSYGQLFYKSIRAMYFAYSSISPNFDWYLKVFHQFLTRPSNNFWADDDTYVIVEHLRDFLDKLDPKQPHYVGYQWIGEGVYHSGGAGYALSNAAMKLFVEKAYNNRTVCPFHRFEDVGIGHCLKNIGVNTTITKESQEQFMPLVNVSSSFNPNLISLHYQSPHDMRLIENLLYNVKSPQDSAFNKP